jgi:succinate-semialdehyde dehydrogenase/glutarate-semialdehyde dehydrogenase
MKKNTYFKSINPYSEELICEFTALDSKENVGVILNEMQGAQKKWACLPVEQRTAFLPKLADMLKQNADYLAEIASLEMGKLLSHAKAEVLKSASLCDYYHQHAAEILAPKITHTGNGSEVKIEKVPLGIVLGIFPWNFPYWQILRSAIPSIVSGNAMMVKPAPNVSQSALALQKLIDQCDELPQQIFNTCLLSNELIETCIAMPQIQAVTFTGSTKTGAYIAAIAGKHIKPIVLELGGSDPLILLNDVHLPEVIDEILFSRFQNNGQSCVAAKRFLVHTEMLQEFLTLAKEKLAAYTIGNPLEFGVDIGPLARKDLLEYLNNQVTESIEGGAKLYWQHPTFPEKGYFFPPSILTDIPSNNIAANEELFGPVLSVFEYSTEEELIAIANNTIFGLGASIFTKDVDKAAQIAKHIESGMVYINQMVKSDPKIPFGGIKNSGFGRELGTDGLLAFCQTKSTWIKKSN